MVNKVILVGNVGLDPEVRTLEGGAKVARIRLATTERLFDRASNETKEHTEWHTITLWRGLADVVDRYVRKGTQLYIEGLAYARVDGQGQQQTLYDRNSGRHDEPAGPSQRQPGIGGLHPGIRRRAGCHLRTAGRLCRTASGSRTASGCRAATAADRSGRRSRRFAVLIVPFTCGSSGGSRTLRSFCMKCMLFPRTAAAVSRA